jgi:hypothetical protein
MSIARRRLIALVASGSLVAALAMACGGEGSAGSGSSAADAPIDRSPAEPDVAAPDALAPADAASEIPLDAACNVRMEAHALEASPHVPEGTAITYATNPPSSGPHYPVWANFQEYAEPVADGYLVHSMEHGAVLLLYKCDPTTCADVISALRAVRDAIATDPLCDPSIRVRVILAPRPSLDVPVAAAAWGYTYRADCVDAPSLTQFVLDHYAKAPEDFCSPGTTF